MREFTLEELEELKKAPRKWSEAEYALFGKFEYWMRQEKRRLGSLLRSVFHGCVRQAHIAYGRARFNGYGVTESPWDNVYGYRRALLTVDWADAAMIPPPERSISVVAASGATSYHLVSEAQLEAILAIVGPDVVDAAEKAALAAAMALIPYEGAAEIVSESEVQEVQPPLKMTVVDRMAKARAARKDKVLPLAVVTKRKVGAVGENEPL